MPPNLVWWSESRGPKRDKKKKMEEDEINRPKDKSAIMLKLIKQ